jgi:hypothetical protein
MEKLKCEWRRCRLDLVESNHPVEERHKSMLGHTYYDPRVEGCFCLYKDNGNLARTSVIKEVVKTVDGFEFDTLNSTYRVTWLPEEP